VHLLKACSASEVAAMLEGLLRHCTEAEIEANYTDTHGASVIGFAFCHLLGFRLLPRLKQIGGVQLYRPDEEARYPGIDGAQTRPIKWELIEQQYDQMVKRNGAAPRNSRGRAGPPPHHPRRPQAPHVPRA
jgi:TnpA family transposase